ncbi:MAG: phospholipase [Muribaculaceae bacterium]|nr:phospholipase [Muribaculaceae bacterium]
MTGALLILAVTVVAGLLLYITDVKYFRHHHSPDSQPNVDQASIDQGSISQTTVNPTLSGKKEPEVCCGLHLVCEKTSLVVTDNEILYYDDEELDRFAGRQAESYSADETEEFRDVLMTLLPQDIPGWAKSMNLRQIELPTEVKDELLMLIEDLRNQSA